jgi:PleD family two-component response regulator
LPRTLTTRGWERLLSHADDAIYEAKRAGKDRAVVD